MSPSLALIENVGQLIAVSCVIGAILLVLIVPVALLYFHHKRQQLWHETARLALEKGQPLPSMPDADAKGRPPTRSANDIRSGLILISVGAGLIIFFYHSWLRYLGAIPGCIGLALLVYGVVSTLAGRKSPPRS